MEAPTVFSFFQQQLVWGIILSPKSGNDRLHWYHKEPQYPSGLKWLDFVCWHTCLGTLAVNCPAGVGVSMSWLPRTVQFMSIILAQLLTASFSLQHFLVDDKILWSSCKWNNSSIQAVLAPQHEAYSATGKRDPGEHCRNFYYLISEITSLKKPLARTNHRAWLNAMVAGKFCLRAPSKEKRTRYWS